MVLADGCLWEATVWLLQVTQLANTQLVTKNNESQPVALCSSSYIKCIEAPHEWSTQYLWQLSNTRTVWYTQLPIALQQACHLLATWEWHVTSWWRESDMSPPGDEAMWLNLSCLRSEHCILVILHCVCNFQVLSSYAPVTFNINYVWPP